MGASLRIIKTILDGTKTDIQSEIDHATLEADTMDYHARPEVKIETEGVELAIHKCSTVSGAIASVVVNDHLLAEAHIRAYECWYDDTSDEILVQDSNTTIRIPCIAGVTTIGLSWVEYSDDCY